MQSERSGLACFFALTWPQGLPFGVPRQKADPVSEAWATALPCGGHVGKKASKTRNGRANPHGAVKRTQAAYLAGQAGRFWAAACPAK